MSRVKIIFIIFFLNLFILLPPANGDDTPQKNTLKSNINTETGKFRASIISNGGAFFLNGDYVLLNGGLGGGFSYKISKNSNLGFYLSPQASDRKGREDMVSISAIAHLTLFQSLGVGMGYQFWQKGDGVVVASRDQLFITIGIGLIIFKE